MGFQVSFKQRAFHWMKIMKHPSSLVYLLNLGLEYRPFEASLTFSQYVFISIIPK